MEPHTHPEYEQTFSRIATAMERVTEVLETHVRLNIETEARFNARFDKLTAHVEELAAHVDIIDLKLSEATDKLNGVIDLMDRHMREHGNN